MKRILVILAILVGLAVVGAAIVIATFDVDRFRPQIVSRLEQALGRPVQLQHVALGWHGGIAIQLKGLVIADVVPEPLLAVDSAGAVLRLGPLLRRQLAISSVILDRPQIHVVRDADGRINLLGLAAVAGPAAQPQGGATVGNQALSFSIGSLQIHDGSVHVELTDPRTPVNLWLRQLDVTVTHIAPGRPMDVALSGALGADRANLRFNGRLTPPGDGVEGSVERMTMSLQEFPIEHVVPLAPPGSPRVRGQLTLDLEGALPTLAADRMAEAAVGQGTIRLRDLTVEELNILRAVFEQLSMIPGLVQRLEERLSPEDRAKLTARDTVFAPVELAIRIEQGMAQCDAVELRTDAFRLTGSGQVRFNGAIQIQSVLHIAPSLSTALSQSVEELRYLANAEGELELPVKIHGSHATALSVLPDLRYVASRVVASKAQEFLGGLLEKALQEPRP